MLRIKWEVSLKSLTSRLRELCGKGGRMIVRASVDRTHTHTHTQSLSDTIGPMYVARSHLLVPGHPAILEPK